MTAKLINSTGLQLLRRYDHRPESVQAALLEEVLGLWVVNFFFGDEGWTGCTSVAASKGQWMEFWYSLLLLKRIRIAVGACS